MCHYFMFKRVGANGALLVLQIKSFGNHVVKELLVLKYYDTSVAFPLSGILVAYYYTRS